MIETLDGGLASRRTPLEDRSPAFAMRSHAIPRLASLLLALGGAVRHHKLVIDPKTIEAPVDVRCKIFEKRAKDLMSATRQLTLSKLAPAMQKLPRGG